eukprot:snap_masked-scaffold238_size242079-processed-gene-0.0 protein:Tk10917 transcript:snap_masked-scaffold238_size242079-processed-gene-0.0-mRNA-1 annotation:"calcineurin b homologous protein 1"
MERKSLHETVKVTSTYRPAHILKNTTTADKSPVRLHNYLLKSKVIVDYGVGFNMTREDVCSVYQGLKWAYLWSFLEGKMSEQEAKRQRVSDLLDAEVDPKRISEIVGVSERTVRNIRAAKKIGNGVERKEGSGGNGLKRNEAFLKSLEAKIKADPTASMRCLADEFDVDEITIRRAVHDDLGFTSYVRTPRHLLTDRMKATRLERCKKVLNFLKSNPATVKIFSTKQQKVFLNPVGERIVNLFFVHGNERLTFPRFARTFAIFRPLKKSTPEDAINSRAAKLQLLFNLADSNNDGFVCKEDLYELLEMMMGAKLGEEQLNLIVDRVLTEADTDTDGKMSLPEFREVTKNLKIEAELAFISFS